MENKLVTLEQAEEYLGLDKGSRFLEQFLYGKDAQIRPKNLNRTSKSEEYVYDLSEIMTLFRDPTKMMLLLKNIGKGNGFVSIADLSDIFNISQSSLVNAKQKGLVTSLLSKVYEVYDDPDFYIEEKFSKLDQMIDTNDYTTRKFLFSKKIKNLKAFSKEFNATRGGSTSAYWKNKKS